MMLSVIIYIVLVPLIYIHTAIKVIFIFLRRTTIIILFLFFFNARANILHMGNSL